MGRYTEQLSGEVECQDAIAGITVATRVRLVPEPDDPRAINVITTDGVKVGSVARDSWLVKAMVDHNTPVASRIMEIVPVAPGNALRRIVLEVLTGQDASDALTPSARDAANAAVQSGAASKSQLGKKPMSLPLKLLLGAVAIITIPMVGATLMLANMQSTRTDDDPKASASHVDVAPSTQAMSKADRLKAMDAKISEVALLPLDRKYDPDGYTKLGKGLWNFSNEYRRWAAYAALQNEKCEGVDAIAVWKGATRSQFSWHIVCGDQRFLISERQARAVRAEFDPKAPPADREKSGASFATSEPIDEPSSTAGNVAVDETTAIDACKKAVLVSASHPSTVEFPLIDYDYKNLGAGRAQLLMSAKASNSFGLQLGYDVECQFVGNGLSDFKMSEAQQ